MNDRRPAPGGDRFPERPNRPGPDRPPFNRPGGFERPGGFDRDRSGPPRGPAAPRPSEITGPQHSFRLKDGDREVEVSGSAPFVRQVLDDLAGVLARLRGEQPSRASTSLPAPVQRTVITEAPETIAEAEGPARSNRAARRAAQNKQAKRGPAASTSNGSGGKDLAAMESDILAILRKATRPLATAAIRKKLKTDVSGQRIRRVLEERSDIQVSDERPATYRLRN